MGNSSAFNNVTLDANTQVALPLCGVPHNSICARGSILAAVPLALPLWLCCKQALLFLSVALALVLPVLAPSSNPGRST